VVLPWNLESNIHYMVEGFCSLSTSQQHDVESRVTGYNLKGELHSKLYVGPISGFLDRISRKVH